MFFKILTSRISAFLDKACNFFRIFLTSVVIIQVFLTSGVEKSVGFNKNLLEFFCWSWVSFSFLISEILATFLNMTCIFFKFEVFTYVFSFLQPQESRIYKRDMYIIFLLKVFRRKFCWWN